MSKDAKLKYAQEQDLLSLLVLLLSHPSSFLLLAKLCLSRIHFIHLENVFEAVEIHDLFPVSSSSSCFTMDLYPLKLFLSFCKSSNIVNKQRNLSCKQLLLTTQSHFGKVYFVTGLAFLKHSVQTRVVFNQTGMGYENSFKTFIN